MPFSHPIKYHLKQGPAKSIIIILWFCWIMLLAAPVQAQLGKKAESTIDSVTAAIQDWPADTLGRRTPRGTVQGFIEAIADENYTKAALYLNLDRKQKKQGEQLAHTLQRLLDHGGKINPYSLINDTYNGRDDDNLGPDLDRIGSATVNGENFDLFLEKTEDPSGGPVWLFSSTTVQRIPVEIEQASTPLVDQALPQAAVKRKWGGVPVGHWLGLLLIALLSYMLAWCLVYAVQFVLRNTWRRAKDEPIAGIIIAFTLPLQLYLALLFFFEFSQRAGISIIVRQRFSVLTVIMGLGVFILLLWRLVDVLGHFLERRMIRYQHQAGLSAVLFLRRGAKIAVFVFGIIALLSTLGFDVTTGLAALGVGGLALALGAQKTVENFVGSVTLLADQPIRVGDFCKVGDTLGTVENIGMRSTRIRTNDRTVVTIPNGDFSSQRIENYAHRDRIWFHPTFGIRCDTSPDQIRYLLVELRSILYAHPKIDPESARVRFIGVGTSSFNLEVFSYVLTREYDEFLEIQEDLLLRMMDVIDASGSGFAYPSQTVYLGRDTGLAEEKKKVAEEKVNSWRETQNLPLPKFSAEQIQSLRNTIPYPSGNGKSSLGKA